MASQAGADIAKFQLGWNKKTQEKYGLEYNPIRYIDEWAPQLDEWCRHFNIEFMASIWSEEGLQTAKSVNMKRYKLAHQVKELPMPFELYREILDYAMDHDKTVYQSGMASTIRVAGIYVSKKYPAYPGQFDMPDEFVDWYGYSDHTHGIAACLIAVARGAKYIEKHFTLDKTIQTIRDHPFSATPDEFEQMVKIGREMAGLL